MILRNWAVLVLALVVAISLSNESTAEEGSGCPTGDPCMAITELHKESDTRNEEPYCCSPAQGNPNSNTNIGTFIALAPGESCPEGAMLCYGKQTWKPELHLCYSSLEEVTGKCCKSREVYELVYDLPSSCVSCYRKQEPDGTWLPVCALFQNLSADPDCDFLNFQVQIGQPLTDWYLLACP